MPENSLDKFKKLLAELFMFDQADLDFGIYRIMNAKREEITRFLDQDLLPQVRTAIGEFEQADRAVLQMDLARAVDHAKAAGFDPERSPRVQEVRQALARTADVEALEIEVFSDLYNFFRRYYSEGDFLSLRRYKEGVYAVPYEGEEVKLHWANSDQYYIKTAEYFRDYTFTVRNGRRVHFRLADADAEQNNNRPSNGQERRFMLRESDAVAEENGELIIRFEYRPDTEKRKQAELNAEATLRILEAEAARNWLADIAAKSPTEKNPDRTVLDQRLTDYTARNTFDYFIHKDLGNFLRRELDFYIKNEIVHLDDIESETAPRVEQYLAKVKAIRRIGHKIIDFLAQIEDFEKQLWLKKKFVISCSYCITLDLVPEKLYPEIASNNAQREEWVQLFAIDKMEQELDQPTDYSVPLTTDFLKCNPHLVVDTIHFTPEFVERLLAGITDFSNILDGVLVWSENFNALNFLQKRFSGEIKSIYIDPPYNTNASPILYKNDYRHSSWLSYARDRLTIGRNMLSDDGLMCITIDDTEFHRLRAVIPDIFGEDSVRGAVAIRSNPSGRSTQKGFAIAHEYGIFVAGSDSVAIGRLERTQEQLARYDEKDTTGAFEWVNFRKHGGANAERSARPKLFYPIYGTEGTVRIPKLQWDSAKGAWRPLEDPLANEQVIWPTNPKGEEKTWKWGHERVTVCIADLTSRREQGGRLGVYFKSRLNQAGTLPLTWWDKKQYSATEYGTNLLTDILGASNKFSFPKSVHAVEDSLRVTNLDSDDWAMDFFAGSGTTAHAIVNLNRNDSNQRHYVLVEVGEHFNTVLKPRIKKIVYASHWKEGKPITRDGVSQFIQCLQLESYEDTLSNLELTRTSDQENLLNRTERFREDYILRYMLDVETKGSASLLNTRYFDDPFRYMLNVSNGSAGETRPVAVDLVETFNWLLGLRVKHIDSINGFRIVKGISPKDEKVLVIWRNTRKKTNAELDDFFLKQEYNKREMGFDVIYVNGDNNLENLKRPDELWKVLLIEEEFKRLMFEAKDI